MKIRVTLSQRDPILRQNARNLRGILEDLRSAAAANSRLIVFPECALSGYGFDSKETALACAEPVPGPSTESVSRACRETSVFAVLGLLERRGDKLYNTAALIGPRGIVGVYRKMHLPWLGVDRFAEPGDLGFPVFDTPIGRIGILICYDLSFPEAARSLKLEGAQLLVVPTNWPMAAEVSCLHAPKVRAQENHINVAACNRTGEEAGFKFRGESSVCDFDGKSLAQAGPNEGSISAEIDMDGADENRVVIVPGRYEVDRIGHRRPEHYGRLVSRS